MKQTTTKVSTNTILFKKFHYLNKTFKKKQIYILLLCLIYISI